MSTTDADAMAAARWLADEVLFPAAAVTDASERVPRRHFDLLAEAGLYGHFDHPAMLEVIEILASGCLTTTFVWMHHLSALRALERRTNVDLRHELLGPMQHGFVRAGYRAEREPPGPEGLTAEAVEGGWLLEGTAPWVSGWGLIDVLYAAARTTSGGLVWAVVDAVDSPSVVSSPLRLLALQASATVALTLRRHFVPTGRVAGVEPRRPAGGSGTHIQATLAGALTIGLTQRCCLLFGPSPLDAELDRTRRALHDAALSDPTAIPAARAAAAFLALRAASALVVATGSRSVLADGHPQRLAREATFLLAFGSRPPVPAALTRLMLDGRAPTR